MWHSCFAWTIYEENDNYKMNLVSAVRPVTGLSALKPSCVVLTAS